MIRTIVSRHNWRRLESSILCMSSNLLSFEAWRRGSQKALAAYCPSFPASWLLAPRPSLVTRISTYAMKVKRNLQMLEATKCGDRKGRNETTLASNHISSGSVTSFV